MVKMKVNDFKAAMDFLESTEPAALPTAVSKDLYDLAMVTYGPEWLEKHNIVAEVKVPDDKDKS
jgi:hypothetical protein